MKYSKAVHVTKHKIREDQNFVYQLYAKHNRDYKYDKANNFACQYDSKNEHPMCTCKIPKRQKLRYVNGSRRLSAARLKCAYHASSSYTDIGVGSVQALQKRKVRKIYLPDTDDRGCGSSDLTSFIVRKNKPQIGSYYDYKKTSSKCVGGILEYKIGCVLSQKLSPIFCRMSNTTNTTNITDQTHTEIGSNTTGSSLVTTGTQFELASQKSVGPSIKSHDENNIKITCNKELEIKTTVQASKVPVKVSEQIPKVKKSSNEQKPKSMEKRTKDAVSSDSLVEHVHNLEDSSYEKQSRTSVDPMENKLEREYRRLFSSKNKESFSKTSVDKPMPEMKSASIVKRRFEALRRGLTKKDEAAKKSVSPSSQDSVQSHKDESITSDPPSLESRSFTDTKKFTPTQSNAKNTNLTTNLNKPVEENAWPQKDTSSESQGVKGMFKLWGKKFDFDEEQKAKHSQNLNKNALAIDIRTKPHKEKNIAEENKKNKKKFFFFKKKLKEKPEMPEEKERERELYQASGVTAGRCEIADGLTLKLGQSQPTELLVMPPSEVYSDASESDEIRRRTWLKKFLSNTIESTRSVNVRWNNSMYAASSSTVFELMDTLYKNTNLVLKSRSDIITDSSYYTHPPKNKVNFDQKIEAWMIPKLIPDRPQETIIKIRSRDGISINLTSSDPRWAIEKSIAFANKIEVVLHSNNYNRTTNTVSSDYLRIDIPKDFFDISSSDASKQNPTSDEEVFKIVEYESDLNNQDLDKGDHAADNISIVLSLHDSQHLGTKILTDIETVIKRPTMVRDVVIQGSNVIIPNRCDVIGVGIITQRDIRDIRKPILKIQVISDNESEEEFLETPQKKCEFAESYLQEYYRHLQPLGADLFAWCASDSHLKSGSERSLTSLLNQGDGSKSCPNIYDDYQSSAVVSSCNTSSCSQCYEPTSFSNKLLNKILQPAKAKTDTDVTSSGKRILPKDSLEVFKRRKIYAAGLKSTWTCSEDNPVSVPSIESKSAQNSIFIECPKCSKMDRYLYKPKNNKRNDKHARLREQPIQVIPPASYNTESLVTIADIPQTSVPLSPRESLQKQPPCEPLPHSKSEPRPRTPTSISSHTKRSLKAFLPKNAQGIPSITFKTVPHLASLDLRQSSSRQRRSQITTIVVGRSVSRNSSPIATGQPCGAADCKPEKCSPEFCQPPRPKTSKSSKLSKKITIKHHGNDQKQTEFQDTHRSAAPTKEKKQTEFKPSTPENLDSAQTEYKDPKTESRSDSEDQRTEYEEPRSEYEESRTEYHDPPSNLNDQPYTPDRAHKPNTASKQKREASPEVSPSFVVQTCTPQQSDTQIKYTEQSDRVTTIETASSAAKTHSPCSCKNKSKKSKGRSFFKKSQPRVSPCDCHQEMKLSFKAIPRMPRCSTPPSCKQPPPCRPEPCSPPPCKPKPCTPPTCRPKPCTPPTCKPKACTPPTCKPKPCSPPSCKPAPCKPPPCKRAPCPPPPCVRPPCKPPPCLPPPCSPPPCSPPPCSPPPCAPKPCYKPPCPTKKCCKSMPKLCPPNRTCTPRPPCSPPPCSSPPCRPKRSCSPPPCPRKRSCSPPRCNPPPCSPPPCPRKRSCSPPRCNPPPCSPPPCPRKRSCSPPRCNPPPCSPPPCPKKRSCSPPPCPRKRSCSPPRCDPPPCRPKRSCSPPRCDPPPCSPPPCPKPRCSPPPCGRKRSCSPPRCPRKRSCSPPRCSPSPCPKPRCSPPPCNPPPCRPKRSCSPPRCKPKRSCSPPKCQPKPCPKPRCSPPPCSPPPCPRKRSCSPPKRCSPPPCPPPACTSSCTVRRKRSCSPPPCRPKRSCSPPKCAPPPCTPPPCRPKRSCSPPKCAPPPCSPPPCRPKRSCSPPKCAPPPCSPPPCRPKRSCSPPKCAPPPCSPPPCRPKRSCSPPKCAPPPCSPPPCRPKRSCSPPKCAPPPCSPPPCRPKRSCSPPKCAPPPCSPPPCRPKRSCSPPKCAPPPCSPPPCRPKRSCSPPSCSPPSCPPPKSKKKKGFCGPPSPCSSCAQQHKCTKSLPCSPKSKKKCCCIKKPRKCPATKQTCHCMSVCSSNPRLSSCCSSPPRCPSPPRCSPRPCSPPPCPKPRCSPPPCSPPPCRPKSCSPRPCPPPSCSPPPCPPKRCAPPRCRSPPRCSPPPCTPPPCPRPRCSPPRCRSSQVCVRPACSAPPVLIRGHPPVYPMEPCCCTTSSNISPYKINNAETESLTQVEFDKCPECSAATMCELKKPSEKNNECPQNCQIEEEFIQLNSCENLTIIRKKSSTAVTRDGMNIKVRDCDGHTLYERNDYGIDNEGRRSSILNEVLYKNSDTHGVSTPLICNMSTEGKDAIVMAEDNSEGNLLEIQFKLRITKGDKTTEIHIGNDMAEPSREINNIKQRDKAKNNIEKVPTGVYLVKKDTKQIAKSIDDINPKHDINIKIIVKSYKTLLNKDTDIKKNRDTFSKKISNKFNTVSTGYNELNTVSTECKKLSTVSTGFNELNTVSTEYSDTAVNQIDDKVFSIHRTTVDLNSSEETNKTFTKESMHSIEKDEAFIEPNNVISSNVYASSMTDASDVDKTTSTKNQDDTYDKLEYVDTTVNEKELDTSQELLDLNTSDECSDVKYSAKLTQKELLKKVMENSHKKPKNKETVRQLRDMLKIILTDSSENDDAGTVRCELVKDVTYQSLEQNYFKNTDSMINYYRTGSSQTIEDFKETPNFQSADENSVCSESDKPQCQSCMCSVLAKSLNCNLSNSCCCKQTKINQNVSCYLLNDKSDNDSEENNVETQISKQPSQVQVSASTENYVIVQYKTEPVTEIHIRDSHNNTDILQMNTVVSKYANDYSIESHSYEAVVDSNITPETQVFKQTKSYSVEYKAEPIIIKQLKQDVEINKEKADGKDISVSNEIETYTIKYKTEPIIMKGSYREEAHIEETIASKDITETRVARNKTTILGISKDDKIVILSEKTDEDRVEVKVPGKHNNNLTFFKKSDVLQCYAAKKAVLEIYAEKSISESGEHLVAKLPKFLMEKEKKITKKLEDITAHCYKSVCSKKLPKLGVKN